MEIQLPPGSAILHGSAGGANFPLDVEERHLTRNLISVERETQEWERVLVEAVTGSSRSAVPSPSKWSLQYQLHLIQG